LAKVDYEKEIKRVATFGSVRPPCIVVVRRISADLIDRILPPLVLALDARERASGSHGCLGLSLSNRQTGSLGRDARVCQQLSRPRG
jgi:hypothetical protein